MNKIDCITWGKDTVFLSNGFPVRYQSHQPIGPSEVRGLERKIEARLGHPVVFLTLSPIELPNDAWEGDLYHPDSVFLKDGVFQNSSYPPINPELIGLWNGKNVSDLYDVFLKSGVLSGSTSGRNRYFVMEGLFLFALQSRRFNQEELKGSFGLVESRRFAYFRDQSGRCLVGIEGFNAVAYCPDISALIAVIQFFKRNDYRRWHIYIDLLKLELKEMDCELLIGNDIQ